MVARNFDNLAASIAQAVEATRPAFSSTLRPSAKMSQETRQT